jgi:CO/xanthine dehydrogenase FAD-binding subunit
MSSVGSYARPASLGEALELLRRPRAVVIGGGTTLQRVLAHAPAPAPEGQGEVRGYDVVDLQAVGLGALEPLDGSTLRLGATVTLERLARSEAVPSAVREAARRERPSTLRAQSTLGGRIAAGEAESELLAALLAQEAMVTVASSDGARTVELGMLLAGLPLARGTVITEVTIATSGRTATARTARTSADRAIVAAAARTGNDGRRRVAMSGVASRPVLVDDPTGLDPPGDFRGSSEYRRALAGVLFARVTKEG